MLGTTDPEISYFMQQLNVDMVIKIVLVNQLV